MQDLSQSELGSESQRRFSRRLVGRRRATADMPLPAIVQSDSPEVPFTALYTPSPSPRNRRSIHLDFTPMTPKRSNPVPRRSFIPQRIPVPNRTFLIGLGVFLVVSALYKAIGMLDSRRSGILEPVSPAPEEPLEELGEIKTEVPTIDLSQYVPLVEYAGKQSEIERLNKKLTLTMRKLDRKIDPSNCPSQEEEVRSCLSNLSSVESSLVTCQEGRSEDRVSASKLLESKEKQFSEKLSSTERTCADAELQLRVELKTMDSQLFVLRRDLENAEQFFTNRLLTPLTVALITLSCVLFLLLSVTCVRSRKSNDPPEALKREMDKMSKTHEKDMAQMRALLAETSALSREIGSIMKEVISDTSQISTHHNSPSASPSGSSLSEKLEASAITPIRVELSNPEPRRVGPSPPVEFSIASPAHHRHSRSMWDE